ncbi:MAG: hypothetical protein GY941_17515 [Planctomycetes bacterium]|nr:hypothetical protein [Planctomycetota bacterium]
MTPKEKYEQRKAERKARRASLEHEHERDEIDAQETIDRAVTAIERLADVAELLVVELLETDKTHEWQPIEIAPKDGTKILVWVPETWVCVSWRTDRNMNGWTAWEDDDYQFHPTHWQPLPPQPGDKPNE